MTDRYTLATNAQGTQVFIPLDGGPLVFREYTREEARKVADWLNGRDQPLPLINVADRPGKMRYPSLDVPPVMRPIANFRVDFGTPTRHPRNED